MALLLRSGIALWRSCIARATPRLVTPTALAGGLRAPSGFPKVARGSLVKPEEGPPSALSVRVVVFKDGLRLAQMLPWSWVFSPAAEGRLGCPVLLRHLGQGELCSSGRDDDVWLAWTLKGCRRPVGDGRLWPGNIQSHLCSMAMRRLGSLYFHWRRGAVPQRCAWSRGLIGLIRSFS
jgi:hypothetical protein